MPAPPAIFPPGTVIAEAAASLIDELNRRLGYEPPARANFPGETGRAIEKSRV